MKLKESIKRKLSIAIVVVMMVSFMFAKTVSAKTFLETAGGKLMKPVLSFAMFIADVIENVLDDNLYAETNRDWYGVKLGGTDLTLVDAQHRNAAIYSKDITGEEAFDDSKLEIYKDAKLIDVEPLTRKLDKTVLTRDKVDVPNGVIYSPYEIFSNKIPLMDVNFLSPHKYEKNFYYLYYNKDDKKIEENEDGNETESVESSAGALQKVVSSWYIALRNISIVAMLSILLYLGIRIVISSSSAEKATYKQELVDWVIGLILIFGMHYIMSFALTMTENVSEILDNASNPLIKVPINVSSQKISWSKQCIVVTNYTGYIRLIAGIANSQENTMVAVEYAIIYLVIIAYTIMYTVIYLKRVIYMAFLTIIAPISAVTYPFRKRKGPGGNAFAIWLREYIMNLLIQPVHLLLYSVVLGSTMELAVKHPVYAIVAFACLLSAERLFSEIFGFKTAQYADSKRTMQTEKRAGRFAAYITGKAIKGTVKGIRMITAGAASGVAGGVAGGAADGDAGGDAEGGSSEEIGETGGEADSEYTETASASENQEESSETTENESDERTTNRTQRIPRIRLSRRRRKSSEDGDDYSYFNGEGNTGNVSSYVDNIDEEDIRNAIDNDTVYVNLGNRPVNSKSNTTSNTTSNSQNTEVKNDFSSSNVNKVEVGSINMQMNFNQVMKDIYPEYEKNGISNIREFNAVYALETSGISRKEAIATYKIAKETGDIRGNFENREQWQKRLAERIEDTNEIQQMMKNRNDAVNTKYARMEKEAKEKYNPKGASTAEYKELSRKMDEVLNKIKAERNSELEKVKQTPIRYASKIITQVENYYDNLD